MQEGQLKMFGEGGGGWRYTKEGATFQALSDII